MFRPVLFLVIHLTVFCKSDLHNNVCPTFKDYDTMSNNTNCYYDFAAESNTPAIIHKSGYPVVEHKVTTDDGYILTLFRIPNPNKQPVFLLHGVQCTSSMFVSLGSKSLAFMLANAGYDVWLGNFRGNEYSEGHVNYSIHDNKFWNFGVDEIALYDVPALLNTVSHNTGNKGNIIYIGHSLGTSLGLIHASEFPEETKNTIKLLILLSPAYSLAHMKSPYRALGPFASTALTVLKNLNALRLASQASTTRQIYKSVCLESSQLMQLCLRVVNLFFGIKTQMAPEKIPVLFNQFPGGTGFKVYSFVADMIANKFRRYDYKTMNHKIYGRNTPPIYNISKTLVPVFLVYSTDDWATTKKDSIDLYKKLPKEVRFGLYEIKDANFNHIDFAFGKRADELVYKQIVNAINKVNSLH